MSSRFGASSRRSGVLCAVELFERFAGTVARFAPSAVPQRTPGMTTGSATRLGGTFNAATHLSSVIGGVIADRWLGTRRAMLIGALLLAFGYAVFSMDRATLLYPAAGLADDKPRSVQTEHQQCRRQAVPSQ